MMTKELYWIIGAFLTAALLTGLFFSFNYTENVEIQLHDTYILVFPVYFGLVLWVILTFFIFLMAGIRTKFAKRVSTWILLLANSLLTIFTLFFAYWIYAFLVSDLIFDMFRETKKVDLISQQFSHIMTTCVVLIILFIGGEFFLIRRVVRLRRAK